MYEESLKTFQPAVAAVLLYTNRKFSDESFPEQVNYCEATGYIYKYTTWMLSSMPFTIALYRPHTTACFPPFYG